MIRIRDNVKGGALTETTFLVLLAFYRPNHGYEVMQWIEEETGGRVSLGAGTAYGAINTLVKRGWITPTGNEDGRHRKEYMITALGRRVAEQELSRLNKLAALAGRVMRGGSK